MNKKVVKCDICGKAHITTGKDHFVHCHKKQAIREVVIVIDEEKQTRHRKQVNRIIFNPEMEYKNGERICSVSERELTYDETINIFVCHHDDCEYGDILNCHARCWKGDRQIHITPYGFDGQDMIVLEGKFNPNAPPASMLNLLVGERMKFIKMKFVPDQDKTQLSQMYYSKRFETVVFEYIDNNGQKQIILLEKLEGHKDYYCLPEGHKQRNEVFIYFRRGKIVTYYDNSYHIKVNGKNEPLIVDVLSFWSKKDGFFFYQFQDRTIKDFEFKQNKKYVYIPSRNLGIVEGEIFRELTEDLCYRVSETIRNEINSRDTTYYSYLVESGNVDIVETLAKRLTRPTQMKEYSGMNKYQRKEFYKKANRRNVEPKGIEIISTQNFKPFILGTKINMMNIQLLYTLYCRNYQKPGAFCISEDEFFSKDEAVLRAVGFFKTHEDEILFKQIKQEVISLINEEYEPPVDFVFNESEDKDEEKVPSKKRYKRQWYDIEQIYYAWQEVKNISFEEKYKVITHYYYYPIQIVDEVLTTTKCIEDLIHADDIIEKLNELIELDNDNLPNVKIIIKFLENFYDNIEVDEWISTEYLKRNEQQDQEEDSLDFCTDYFEHTQDLLEGMEPHKRQVFTNIVKLSAKGQKRFDRLKKKFDRPLEFKKNFFGGNPIPQDIFSEGENIYKELQKTLKDKPEDENLMFEEVLNKLVTQDDNITIINYDENIMDGDYKIKSSDTMSVIGASQIVRDLLIEEHEIEVNGKSRTIIDDAPLVRAICGYFISLKKKPKVVISGLGNGVDSALMLAIFLLNKYCGYKIKLVLACPGNILEFFEDTKVNRAIIGYCYKEKIPIISFVKTGHIADLEDENYFDPYYRFRNQYMGENSDRVVNFMSRKVGGTAYTCEVKRNFHKESIRLRQQSRAYKKAAKRAEERGEWKKSDILYDLSEAKNKEAQRIDGKVIYVIKPEDVVEGPLSNWPARIVPSSSEIDHKINDRYLCLIRYHIIKDLTAPYADKIYSMIKRWNKDLLISLMVILGRDFELVDDSIKNLFFKIIGEKEYNSLRIICSNDQTLEYYELLGQHMDAYFDPRYFQGHNTTPWKCSSRNKKVKYGDLFKVDHQLVDPHFIEVRRNSSNKKEQFNTVFKEFMKLGNFGKPAKTITSKHRMNIKVIVPPAHNYEKWITIISKYVFYKGVGSLGGSVHIPKRTFMIGDKIMNPRKHMVKATYQRGTPMTKITIMKEFVHKDKTQSSLSGASSQERSRIELTEKDLVKLYPNLKEVYERWGIIDSKSWTKKKRSA